jgi:hypothetical protein
MNTLTVLSCLGTLCKLLFSTTHVEALGLIISHEDRRSIDKRRTKFERRGKACSSIVPTDKRSENERRNILYRRMDGYMSFAEIRRRRNELNSQKN